MFILTVVTVDNDSISASIVEVVVSAIAFVCLPLNVNSRFPPFALHSIVWISLLAAPVPVLDV